MMRNAPCADGWLGPRLRNMKSSFSVPRFIPQSSGLKVSASISSSSFCLVSSWIELGGACRIVFTQRVPFPRLRHHDARQVRVAIEGNTKHFPGFALVPVSIREYFGQSRNMEIVFSQCHLEHDVAITLDGDQMVENGKIRGR